jgi:hypothetical protein
VTEDGLPSIEEPWSIARASPQRQCSFEVDRHAETLVDLDGVAQQIPGAVAIAIAAAM